MTNKTTDTIQAVETMIMKRLEILKNGETNELKRKARKEILKLEKHLRDVDDKLINGKKYPERMYHSGPEPMNKKEVDDLIDTVAVQFNKEFERTKMYKEDLTGVSVGKTRFSYVDKGWPEPKAPKQ